MPHGFQWGPEDLYNARRAAEIQAQALEAAARRLQKEQERDARRAAQRQPETRERVERAPLPRMSPESAAAHRIASAAYRAARLKEDQARGRANVVKNSVPGSLSWIRSRYGNPNWVAKVKEYQERFGCTKEEAEQLVVRDFKEEEWRHLEDERVEELLGNR